MREKLKPWMPAILCGGLSLIAVTANVVGRFITGSENAGLLAFLGCMPMCFFQVGVMLKDLKDENDKLKRRLDESLLEQKNVPARGPVSD